MCCCLLQAACVIMASFRAPEAAESLGADREHDSAELYTSCCPGTEALLLGECRVRLVRGNGCDPSPFPLLRVLEEHPAPM